MIILGFRMHDYFSRKNNNFRVKIRYFLWSFFFTNILFLSQWSIKEAKKITRTKGKILYKKKKGEWTSEPPRVVIRSARSFSDLF